MSEVPKDARDILIAGALEGDGKVWVYELALAHLDAQEASVEAMGSAMREMLAAGLFADWHSGVLGWHEADEDSREMMLQHADTAMRCLGPLVLGGERAGLERAAEMIADHDPALAEFIRKGGTP